MLGEHQEHDPGQDRHRQPQQHQKQEQSMQERLQHAINAVESSLSPHAAQRICDSIELQLKTVDALATLLPLLVESGVEEQLVQYSSKCLQLVQQASRSMLVPVSHLDTQHQQPERTSNIARSIVDSLSSAPLRQRTPSPIRSESPDLTIRRARGRRSSMAGEIGEIPVDRTVVLPKTKPVDVALPMEEAPAVSAPLPSTMSHRLLRTSVRPPHLSLQRQALACPPRSPSDMYPMSKSVDLSRTMPSIAANATATVDNSECKKAGVGSSICAAIEEKQKQQTKLRKVMSPKRISASIFSQSMSLARTKPLRPKGSTVTPAVTTLKATARKSKVKGKSKLRRSSDSGLFSQSVDLSASRKSRNWANLTVPGGLTKKDKQAVLAAAIEREARAEENVERIKRDKRLQLQKRRERIKRAEAYRKTNAAAAAGGGDSFPESKKERKEGEQSDQENKAPSNTTVTADLFRVNPSFIANVDELVANASPYDEVFATRARVVNDCAIVTTPTVNPKEEADGEREETDH